MPSKEATLAALEPIDKRDGRAGLLPGDLELENTKTVLREGLSFAWLKPFWLQMQHTTCYPS